MNIKLLRQLEALNCEIARDQERLQRYRAKVTTAGAHWGSRERIGDERDAVIAEIVDLSRRISNEIRRRMALRAKILEFIDNIPDATTREIFKLRYIDARSWREVSRTVHLSESAVKKRHAKVLGGK